MFRKISISSAAVLLALSLASCSATAGDERAKTAPDTNKLQVVTTFSILGDMVQAIGGDLVEIHSIVPLGVDPHEYTPLPLDVTKATDADMVVWNGLNMEFGGGWFPALLESVGKDIDSPQVVESSAGVEPRYLASEDGAAEEMNPHAFLDPTVGLIYAANIRDALMANDPENAALYEANGAAYLEKIEAIDQLYHDKIAEIPAEHRVLVTSEHAYQYMAETYGLTPGYIWEIDTDEQGTPAQINALVALVRSTGVPVLFVESNVDPRPMETISAETGTPIHGKIFSDELGTPGGDGESYLKMLTFNITQIHAGLAQ